MIAFCSQQLFFCTFLMCVGVGTHTSVCLLNTTTIGAGHFETTDLEEMTCYVLIWRNYFIAKIDANDSKISSFCATALDHNLQGLLPPAK